MNINIAEKKATAELDEQDFASNPKKDNLGPVQAKGTADAKAEAKLVQDDDDALFEDLLVAEDLLDTDRKYLDCEAAEDADDEFSSDDDYKKILPLNIKKAKTGKDVKQAHLSTNQPEQTTETTANKDSVVQGIDTLAQAQKETKLSDHILTRAPTPYPEPLAVNQLPELLHFSPPLRRRKGSKALKRNKYDTATAHSTMPKTKKHKAAPYDHDQNHTADLNPNSGPFLTPTHGGKMIERRANQNAFLDGEKLSAATMGQSSETFTSSEDLGSKNISSASPKALAVLGYGQDDNVAPTKSVKNPTKSAKAIRGKKSVRDLLMRGFKQKPKKAGGQEDSHEVAIHQMKAAKERGLREEREIRGRIKGKLAEKDVANGGVRGAGMPRIDYGVPGLGTALGGSGPTEEERAEARGQFEGN